MNATTPGSHLAQFRQVTFVSKSSSFVLKTTAIAK